MRTTFQRVLIGAVAGLGIAAIISLYETASFAYESGYLFQNNLSLWAFILPACAAEPTKHAVGLYLSGLFVMHLIMLTPVAILVGGLYGWFVSKMVPSQAHLRSTVLAKIATCAGFVMLLVSVLIQALPTTTTRFTPARWCEAVEDRKSMMPDLFHTYQLRGKTCSAVQKLLGPPDVQDATFHLSDPHVGHFGYDLGGREFLEFRYDKVSTLVTDDVYRWGAETNWEVPDLDFANGLVWCLADEKNKKLEQQSLSSFQLACAAKVSFDGREYNTPTLERTLMERRLRSMIHDDFLVLNSQRVRSWSAIQLPSGRIFVCGGQLESEGTSWSLRSTWIIEPDLLHVSDGPTMSIARSMPCLTLLHDGRVLITGGERGNPSPECEIYDPAARTFAKCAALCVPRADHTAVQLDNGNVLVVGGHTTKQLADEDDNLTSTVEQLDLTANQWRVTRKLVIAGSERILIPLKNNRVLVVGGWHVNHIGDYRWIRAAEMFGE